MEKNENIKVEANTEVSEVVETAKTQGFMSKAGAWMKKHGKKAAIGAAILTGATIVGAIVLGKRSKSDEIEDFEDDVEDDITDVDYEVEDDI